MIRINVLKENLIVFYPNPTTGELRIESGALKIEKTELFDCFGRKQKFEYREQNVIDISNFENGVYIIKTKTDSGLVVQKIIKL